MHHFHPVAIHCGSDEDVNINHQYASYSSSIISCQRKFLQKQLAMSQPLSVEEVLFCFKIRKSVKPVSLYVVNGSHVINDVFDNYTNLF